MNWAAVNGAHSFTVTRGEGKGEYPLGDVNPAIVEKCRDPERGTIVFFCLGIRGDGSWAATEYLIRNWKHLAAEFDDRDYRSMPRLPKDREIPRRLQGANQTQHWRPADYYKRCRPNVISRAANPNRQGLASLHNGISQAETSENL